MYMYTHWDTLKHSHPPTPTHTHTHTQIDNDGLHDLNVQANWQQKGGTYWVRFINIDLIGGVETSGAANFKPGDKVRVKRSITTPKYGLSYSLSPSVHI